MGETQHTALSEEQVETGLIHDLALNGYQHVKIENETQLLTNFREQFTHHNRHLFTPENPLTGSEWSNILTGLNKSRSIYNRTLYVNEPQTLVRDDGTTVHYTFVNPDGTQRNTYQVTRQTTMRNGYEIRYDVVLLINGLPLAVIELKKPGKALRDAHGQIVRYHKQASALFRYTRMYIISNSVNTRYFAANDILPELSATFVWADRNNTHISKLQTFTEMFLTRAHLTKMLFRYTVLNHTRQALMVMRPYQVWAAEAVVTKVGDNPFPNITSRTPPTNPSQSVTETPEDTLGKENPSPDPTPPPVRKNPQTALTGDRRDDRGGYIWHTTGSGKTLTSFKTAQLLIRNPHISKVVFVVDRNDLDYQTQKEFNSFHPGSVDGTSNTRDLVRQLTDPHTRLVITTIQKLNNAVKRPTKQLAKVAENDTFVFLFDECHRSQFGDTHERINNFFRNKYLFGFTGTPIFGKNHVQKRTTHDIFGEQLHAYIIKDGISDNSVLPFAVEYVGAVEKIVEEHTNPNSVLNTNTNKNFAGETPPATAKKEDTTPPYGTPGWITHVDDFIVNNHHTKTFYNHTTKNFVFQAILAADSVPSAIQHYDNLWRAYTSGKSVIKPAVIYTFDPNGQYDYAPQIDDDAEPVPLTFSDMVSARDKLAEAISNYNHMFGTNHRLQDGGFAAYYQDVGKKLREGSLNLLIVVNMFLTGYDNPTLNTLYVDKNLQYHGLIQAFSRTNRVLFTKQGGRDAPAKPYGNIVAFRPLKPQIDEAIALYADPDASNIIIRKPYDKLRTTLVERTELLTRFTPTPESVDELSSEEDKTEFARLFRNLLATHNEISSYVAYTHDTELFTETLPNNVFLNYKSKYVDLRDTATKMRVADPNKASPLTEFDFDLVSLRSETINVDYILKLLKTLHREASETVPAPGVNTMETPELAVQLARLKETIAALDDLDPKKEWLQQYVDVEVFPADKPLPPLKDFTEYLAERREDKLAELAKKLHLDVQILADAYGQYVYDGVLDASDLRLLANPAPATLSEKNEWRKRLEGWFLYMKETFDE